MNCNTNTNFSVPNKPSSSVLVLKTSIIVFKISILVLKLGVLDFQN